MRRRGTFVGTCLWTPLKFPPMTQQRGTGSLFSSTRLNFMRSRGGGGTTSSSSEDGEARGNNKNDVARAHVESLGAKTVVVGRGISARLDPPKRLASQWMDAEVRVDVQKRLTDPIIHSSRFQRQVDRARERRRSRATIAGTSVLDSVRGSSKSGLGSLFTSNPLSRLIVPGGESVNEHGTTTAQFSASSSSSLSEQDHQDLPGRRSLKKGRGMLTIKRQTSTNVEWIDVVSQRTTSLEEYRNGIAMLLLELGVHETLIENTMESVLLPQTILFNQCASIVLRTAVSDTTPDMDSIQELTNRLTIIVMTDRDLVITIHRPEMDFLEHIRSDWEAKYSNVTKIHLLNMFVKRCAKTYQEALSKSIVLFDDYESKLFVPQKQRSQLARQIYHIKRRASVYSRVLALLFESYTHLTGILQIPKYDVFIQDVAQHIAHIRSLSDELNDNANAVLQLLFQLSSYQLNELMRVLTMFSAFFIPLTFITGTYGMNFEHLPGTKDENGPIYCFGFMAMISCGLMLWFRVKGFW